MDEARLEGKGIATPLWITRSLEGFTDGAYKQSAEIVFQGPGLTVYRGAESSVVLPEIGKASLRVDYRDKKSDKEKDFSTSEVRFHYDVHSKEHEGTVAQMIFVPEHDGFTLTHRLVAEEHRNKGIGTSLLKDSEAWVGALADRLGRDISVRIPTAQIGVIRWALENGYHVDAYDNQLLQEVLEHPERFETESFQGNDNITREGYLFAKNDRRERSEGTAIRFIFRKILPGHSEV